MVASSEDNVWDRRSAAGVDLVVTGGGGMLVWGGGSSFDDAWDTTSDGEDVPSFWGEIADATEGTSPPLTKRNKAVSDAVVSDPKVIRKGRLLDVSVGSLLLFW